jgi:hypothetical protein
MIDFICMLNIILFSFLLFFLLVPTNTLNFMLIIELVWILIYTFCCILGFFTDSTLLLAIPLFCLVFSALEFSIGLILFFLG